MRCILCVIIPLHVHGDEYFVVVFNVEFVFGDGPTQRIVVSIVVVHVIVPPYLIGSHLEPSYVTKELTEK